jgi:hypothetical protein
MMNVFFDTEFSGTEKKNGYRYLISIGLVTQDGREFYAELTDTWDESLCSMWVIENVLPLLQDGDCQMKVSELAQRLKGWIEALEGEVVLRTDAPAFDWPFIEEIFNFYGWPTNLRKKYGTVNFESDRQNHRYASAVNHYFKFVDNGKRQHHALVDARSIQYAWKYAIKRGF